MPAHSALGSRQQPNSLLHWMRTTLHSFTGRLCGAMTLQNPFPWSRSLLRKSRTLARKDPKFARYEGQTRHCSSFLTLHSQTLEAAQMVPQQCEEQDPLARETGFYGSNPSIVNSNTKCAYVNSKESPRTKAQAIGSPCRLCQPILCEEYQRGSRSRLDAAGVPREMLEAGS